MPCNRCVRVLCEHGKQDAPKAAGGDPGILAASGLVAGEGLAGVLTAGLVPGRIIAKSKPVLIPGPTSEMAAVGMILLTCAFLYRAGRKI